VDDKTAADAIEGVLRGTATELKTGKVFRDPAGLIVKEIDDATARTEAAALALGGAIGLEMPAARVVSRGGKVYLVVRDIPGQDLAEKTLSSLLVFRKDYARQRAFRAWLGDSDGHLFNMKVGDDGRLWQLDFDMASLEGTKLTQLGLPLDDQADVIRAAVGFVRGSRGLPAARDPGWQGVGQRLDGLLASRDLYAWMAKMDDLVGYDDMKDVVQRIQQLAADQRRLETLLRDAGVPDVAGVARTLRERASVLGRVLQDPALFGRAPRTSARPGRVLALRPLRSVAPARALAPRLAA
jgi:hypothetical protein